MVPSQRGHYTSAYNTVRAAAYCLVNEDAEGVTVIQCCFKVEEAVKDAKKKSKEGVLY